MPELSPWTENSIKRKRSYENHVAGSLTVRPFGKISRLWHIDRKVAWDWAWESLKQWCLKSVRKDKSMDRTEQTVLLQLFIFIF